MFEIDVILMDTWIQFIGTLSFVSKLFLIWSQESYDLTEKRKKSGKLFVLNVNICDLSKSMLILGNKADFFCCFRIYKSVKISCRHFDLNWVCFVT